MRIFLTGASGFLGGELAPRLLARGHEIYALTRSRLAYSYPALHEITGDITAGPDLGISHALPGQLDQVVHLAALTSLSPGSPEKTRLINTQGTENILAFAITHGVKRLHYASTLYIAGDYAGERAFSEQDFFLGQHFKNPYEESKFRAEAILREGLLQASIYRLGILVGSARDGRANSFDSFYKPVKAIFTAQHITEKKLGFPRRSQVEDFFGVPRLNIPIRIWGDPSASMMLTPVDDAAELMAEKISLAEQDHGPDIQTYHVCPEAPVKNSLTAETICEALEITGFHFALEHRKGLHAPLDMLYNRLVRDFLPYVTQEASFETRTPVSSIDRRALLRILGYFRDRVLSGEVPHLSTSASRTMEPNANTIGVSSSPKL